MHVYKGETLSKAAARQLIWWQHERLLGFIAFRRVPHVFLASRIAGDVEALRGMGVAPDKIWAVESDAVEYEQLFDRHKKEKFRLFTRKVEEVLDDDNNKAECFQSVYLDFCGNIQGTARTRRRVVSKLPAGSVLSITNFLGRETEHVENRETALLADVRKHTLHPVSLVQSVSYTSTNDMKGSAMTTWTFVLGTTPSRGKIRFDLNPYKGSLLGVDEVKEIWQSGVEASESRSLAACQANATRKRAS